MYRRSTRYVRAVFVAAIAIAMVLPVQAAIAADDTGQCMEFEVNYEMRPGAARSLIGQEVEVATFALPAWMAGLDGTVNVRVENGPSVHQNNSMVLSTGGTDASVLDTESGPNGITESDVEITLGGDLTVSYVIGARARGDVPGVEGASISAVITVCAEGGCLPADEGILFEIGVFDPVDEAIPGGWKAYYGAAEYPANDEFAADGARFTATNAANPTPDFPGYLAPMRMSEILAANPNVEQNRPLTNAAPSVTIEWTQCLEADVAFVYARYGSESDDVTLDGQPVAQPTSQEDVLVVETYDLGILGPGPHELTITYVGGGRADGHYIDAIRMEAQPVP